MWTTSIVAGREAEYHNFARARSRLMFLSQPGCLGVLFLKSADGKHAACSFWKREEDIAALAGSLTYRATVADLLATGVLVGEATISLYDVELGAMQGVDFLTAIEESVSQ